MLAPNRPVTDEVLNVSKVPSISSTGAPALGQLTVATGSFYGDSFVKPFLVVRAAMFARMPVLLDRSIWQI